MGLLVVDVRFSAGSCSYCLDDDGIGSCDDGYIGVNDGEDNGECKKDDAGEDVEDDGDGENDGYRKNNGASEEDSNEVYGDDEEEDEDGSKSDLIDQVCAYLTTDKYKDSCDKNKKRMIRKKAQCFTMIEGVLHYALHSRGKGEEKDSSRMSCAPNIRSLRFDENIVSFERKIHVAWLRKGCFKNGMFLCT